MFIRKILTLLILITGCLGLPGPAYAQQGTDDSANFLFVNYIGQEMTFDLDDVTYTIPGSNVMPDGGQLALALPPGEHKYAANIPGIRGRGGEFTIVPGQQVGLGAIIEQTSPVLDNEGILLEKPQDYVSVFSFDPQAPAVQPVPMLDTWQPSVATPGMQSVVYTNYVGDELTIDLNGQQYTVPAVARNIPGRLQLDVPPGETTFSATVPYGGLSGSINGQAGQVTGLTISAEPPPEPEYVIGEEYEPIVRVDLRLFVEDLTARAAAAISNSPVTPASGLSALPESGSNVETPAAPALPVVAVNGLLVSNYAGDALTFTIADQSYTIANNATSLLDVPAGFYTFSASIPFVSTTGTVNIDPVLGATMSIVLDVGQQFLTVYQ